jgi:hypothetical protein
MTPQLQANVIACRAMREWDVIVRNVVEKVNFVLVQQETSCNRMDWRIAPSFVEESTVAVKGVEVVEVRF